MDIHRGDCAMNRRVTVLCHCAAASLSFHSDRQNPTPTARKKENSATVSCSTDSWYRLILLRVCVCNSECL